MEMQPNYIMTIFSCSQLTYKYVGRTVIKYNVPVGTCIYVSNWNYMYIHTYNNKDTNPTQGLHPRQHLHHSHVSATWIRHMVIN